MFLPMNIPGCQEYFSALHLVIISSHIQVDIEEGREFRMRLPITPQLKNVLFASTNS